MPFNDAYTFRPTTPEVAELLNGETIRVGSPDDRRLFGDSPRLAGFLEPSPQPAQLLDWDVFSALVDTLGGRITLATGDREAQQHTPQIDSFVSSNSVAQVMEMPIPAKLPPSYASDITDGVHEDSGNGPNEICQSPILESRDTCASSHLNFGKPVDDVEDLVPTETTTWIPQRLYQPRGKAEREKYVQKAKLSSPITFNAKKPSELGIALEEILKKNSKRLSDREDPVFEEGSRSFSLRIEWPGYHSWTCQLLTRDYRKKPRPITRGKLAKNVAIRISKFMNETRCGSMEDRSNPDPDWRISPDGIKFEDIILVSLDHVSQGSWQPQLRLRRQVKGGA